MTSSATENKAFTSEWIEWIQENLELNVPIDDLIKAMIQDGIAASTAEGMIQAIALSSASKFEAPKQAQAEKMYWILHSLAKLDSLSAQDQTIPRVSSLSDEEFFECFYSKNLPVIIEAWEGYAWLRESTAWDQLSSRYGEQEVEIQSNRVQDPLYERNSDSHKSRINFGEFLTLVNQESASNEIYMTANNGHRNSEIFSEITDAVEWMPTILDRESSAGKSFIWIGPKGTVTPLHHDLTNNLVIQAQGEKEIQLFPPCYFSHISNELHCYSKVDLESPDRKEFPLFDSIKIRRCHLREGEMLFLPLGWWHHVKSTSPSVSITATHFREFNSFARSYSTYSKIATAPPNRSLKQLK